MSDMTYKPGTTLQVTFPPAKGQARRIRPNSVIGVLVEVRDGILCLDHYKNPGSRYGMTSVTWGRIFPHQGGLMMSVMGAPAYQAQVVEIVEIEPVRDGEE